MKSNNLKQVIFINYRNDAKAFKVFQTKMIRIHSIQK